VFCVFGLAQNRCTCLYSTLHTHPRSHRLWSVFSARDVLASAVEVSRDDTVQHPEYEFLRIHLPRTPVHREGELEREPTPPGSVRHPLLLDLGRQVLLVDYVTPVISLDLPVAPIRCNTLDHGEGLDDHSRRC
jgi:hypothetical protein